jgi:hypothetical protein
MKIFYNPRQSCTEAASYSPSAGKPELFVADALKHFPEVEVMASGAASQCDIHSVHRPYWVEQVLNGYTT